MRTTAALAAYLAGVFAGAGALSPWIWRLAHAVHAGAWLDRQPFHRYVDRCLLGLAVAGLGPLARSLGVRRQDFSLCWTKSIQSATCVCALLGLGMLGLAAGGSVAAGARAWEAPGFARAAAVLAKGAATAIVVAAVEEFLFRGGLYGAIRRRHNVWAAAGATSVLYSISHFFKPAPDPTSVDAFSGFRALAEMAEGLVDPAAAGAFAALAVAGAALAGLRERHQSLWPAAGMHAGWVLGIKAAGAFTRRLPGPTALWGGDRIFDGWIAAAILTAAAAAIWTRVRPAGALAPPEP